MPAAYSEQIPIVELISELPSAPSTIKPSASRNRDSAGSKSSNRRRRKVPDMAAIVAPAACPAAANGDTDPCAATTNALSAIPGQTRYPYIRNDASAIPYAGQTGPRLLLRMLVVA